VGYGTGNRFRGIDLLYEGEGRENEEISHIEELGFHIEDLKVLLKLESPLWKPRKKNISVLYQEINFFYCTFVKFSINFFLMRIRIRLPSAYYGTGAWNCSLFYLLYQAI
jgi:hypothetical protein